MSIYKRKWWGNNFFYIKESGGETKTKVIILRKSIIFIWESGGETIFYIATLTYAGENYA